ncbi:MBL fold metallo-hydrolase [Sinomonas sp. ASV486]|uniref:MBL fold metallo-hydrolase n=1 Tax=Sinomonas sp. ASV486 TaxID=3051170 RepID=UPI0027DBF82E|nr:MBL fold metallo-hydrolase [Sinomonas sp. ASV486]MDQ4490112.1 MBL fold metallo-hydrolase [Sinomonas sp. ASV486]
MAVEVTGTAQREAWLAKAFPPVERLDDGLWSVPIPFPGNPMRYTLSYVLVEGDECLVVDPGFDSDEGWGHLTAGLGAAGIGAGEVTCIIATHFHTDHLGMACRLSRVSGAPIGLGEAERRYLSVYEDAREEVELDRERMRRWGVPESRVAEGAMTVKGLEHLRGLADADFRLASGDAVPFGAALSGHDPIRVIETPGHTPGHLCLELANRAVFLSGDHLLPRITPNVSLEIRGDPDPVGSYVRSLQRVELADHYEVLPAHEYRFRGPGLRARQLRVATEERSRQVREAASVQPDPTVYSVARDISWSRGFDSLHRLQFRLALSETAAHLQHLALLGLVTGIDTVVQQPTGVEHSRNGPAVLVECT